MWGQVQGDARFLTAGRDPDRPHAVAGAQSRRGTQDSGSSILPALSLPAGRPVRSRHRHRGAGPTGSLGSSASPPTAPGGSLPGEHGGHALGRVEEQR